MRKTLIAVVLAGYSAFTWASFDVVALGTQGGLSGDNLTSYLIRTEGDARYIALDAGSTLSGIAKGIEKGSFPDVTPEKAAPLTPQGYIFREQVNAYFISHPHLDHVAGLILGSPDDKKKTIYTLADSANTLHNHYFNWKSWPNFSDAGNGERLGTYRINSPRVGQTFTLGVTPMRGVIYPLSHNGTASSMLLISARGESFAYFGDTGADAVERSKNLDAIWRVLGPLIQQKALKGMIIETSYDDAQPDNKLLGHLTPKLLLSELTQLEKYSGGAGSLKDLPIVISHIKPTLVAGKDPQALIQQQLSAGNSLGVKFMFMQQGDKAVF
ncbi:MAG: MBL fold metallo-hydrolase [Hafnia alvei]|uniref:MBL fold metallo-hydrolase n=1 Tax=Hafnia alvei TaxID=569 RepID=UPI003F924B08